MGKVKTEYSALHRRKPAHKKQAIRRAENKRYSIARIIGLFDGPADLSQRHDEYLYSKKETSG